MARIRTIKPEFFRSPSTAQASPWARLLYIAMWSWADDYGRAEWTPRELLGFAFPHDEESPCTAKEFPTLLKEVAGAFGTQFYTVGGRRFYAIPTWDSHQRTERKAKCRIPGPNDPESTPDKGIHGSEGFSDASEGSSARSDGSSSHGTGEQGNRGTGEQDSCAPDDAHTPAQRKKDPSAEPFAEWWKHYPRKIAKGQAANAYRKAFKSVGPEVLLEAVTAYAQQATGLDKQFIPYPASWLNAERWDDDITAQQQPHQDRPAVKYVTPPPRENPAPNPFRLAGLFEDEAAS